MHISSVAEGLEKGSKVYEGQVLGATGNTGKYKDKNGNLVNYPAHLHLDATDKNGKQIDPEGKNYGKYTNEEFFGQYGGDYKKLPSYPDKQNSGSADVSLPQSYIEMKQDATRVAKPVTPILNRKKTDE